METSELKVDETYLFEKINKSSEVGKTANNGLYRLALTHEDKLIRDDFISWMKEESLDVRVDDFGNIYGRRKGINNEASPIVIGSHLDTQPYGGRFDGVLGVLGGLSVIKTLNDYNIETERPIELINFTNEEGARFPQPMVASGGLIGEFKKSYIYNLADNEGTTYEEALEHINYKGLESQRIKEAHSFLELHIEQGPVLENEHKDIGIVQGIQGMTWLSINIKGLSNHAGSTPMQDRKDAFHKATAVIQDIYEIAEKHKGLNITIGKVDVSPNVPNVIPGEVQFIVDIRHQNKGVLTECQTKIEQFIAAVSNEQDYQATVSVDWAAKPTVFANNVTQVIKESTESLKYSNLEMYSGPGHDAKHMAGMTDTGMIFVPSHKGISHNEAELTYDKHIIQGVEVLLKTVNKLANNNK
ncbi:M20 family metallo-hydrolase [Staphylococcus durrellii]|uniref:M20 family metallo-hydrolase n=1 Tax=Staphylococcus durrellii TaxID=2781773 RepID=UPI00189E9180|nr:M20 family metallo-hydrolase [Staphylococcus durrellii]MBF7015949.1 M20 family metallo-hydrolase [Staphylococcus durrellii]